MSEWQDGRKSGVYPGQNWRDPEGEVWHVDAIAWDGTERSAFLEDASGSIIRLPAQIIADTYQRVAPRPLAEEG